MLYRIRDGNNEEMPPLTEAQLRALAVSGYISPQTLAYDERSALWRPISEITRLAALFQQGVRDDGTGQMPGLSAPQSWTDRPGGPPFLASRDVRID